MDEGTLFCEMERTIDDQDFNEIEMLLGEIPNITSMNHVRRQTILTNPPQKLSSVSMGQEKVSSPRSNETKFYNFHHPASNLGIHMEDCPILPDEKSLMLLFEELRIKEILSSKPMCDASVMNEQRSLNHNFWHNKQITNHQNQFHIGYGPLDMNFSQSGSINGVTLSSIELEARPLIMKRNEYENVGARIDDGYKPNQISEGLLGNLSEHHQFFPVKTTAMPLKSYFNTYELTPNIQEIQFPNAIDRHHYQQSLYLQNQSPNILQHYTEGFSRFPPTSSFRKDPHLNVNTIYDKSNMLEYWECQPQDSSGRVDTFWSSNEHKVISANSFPEKILTRSHGVNCVKVLKSNPFTIDKQNRLGWSNGNVDNGSLLFSNQRNKNSCHSCFCSGIVSNSLQKRSISVREVAGTICLMAKDQHGCRFLQKKFAEGCQEDIDIIFSEIILHISELMTDPFGNYLVQKLIEVCNEEQMMLILKAMTRNTNELMRISCDMHGTRAVQKVIETVRTPEQISLVVSSLNPCIISVMKDINGNHVAQRCLQYLSKYCELLIDAVITHCIELATDRQGCCVLQRCLVHADVNQKQRLITEISACSLILSKDQFGNYVVQFVLDLKEPWATTLVLKHLMGNYEHLSVQKYSSNVVERCLNLAEAEHRVNIIQELMRSPLLSHILQDPYGNYVIQTALNVSKVQEDLHSSLLNAVISRASTLRGSPYGKKVLAVALQHLKK